MEIVFIRWEPPRIIRRSLTEAADEKFIGASDTRLRRRRRRRRRRNPPPVGYLAPVIFDRILLFFFIYFLPSSTSSSSRFLLCSPRRIVSRGSKRGEGVEIAEAHSRGPGGNERFTSEIRMARRKSISGASTPIVLPIPRATFSARNENCKLPVYDISQRVRRAFVCGERKRTGAKKRIEIITPGANRNFVLSVLTQSIRRYPITEKNTRVSKRGREFSR